MVPPQQGGTRPLADYLASRFTYYDREGWMAQIAAGKLTVDDSPAGLHDAVGAGQTVTYDAGEFEEPPADLAYSIIYEDEWLFAVNKPGNLLIHRAGKSFRNNLMYQLRSVHTPPYPAANSIHRLDRHTSGVVLIAKTPGHQAAICAQFTSRKINKTYIAIVHGIPPSGGLLIDKPIGKDAGSATGPRFRIDEAGKEAISRIDACEAVGSSFAQLVISPLTGRTHQIRVHCASIGHPIVGDIQYGSDLRFPGRPDAAEVPVTSSRHALHCMRIRFMHPWKKTECCVEAPLPADMLAIKEVLAHRRQSPGRNG